MRKKKKKKKGLEEGPVSLRTKAKSCGNRIKLNCMQSLVVPMSVDREKEPLRSTL